MGILAVDSIKSRTVAPVTVSDDLNVTGVSTVGVLTATSVVVGSAVTANSSGIIAGLVTATTFSGAFSGTTGTFSGDVSIGGTLTYEDVERVDATGLSTFREGLNVGSPTGVGGTFDPAGGLSAGIGSFSSDLNIADKIVHLGDTDTTIRFPSADTITAETAGSERLRIDDSGRVLLGNSTSTATQGVEFFIQQSGTDFATSGIAPLRYSNNTSGPTIAFAHSRNASLNVQTILQDGDEFGKMRFYGSDGVDFTNYGAQIRARVDGTPGADDMPGCIEFATTPSGSTASTERLKITSAGGFKFSNGELIENCNVTAGKLSDNQTINLDNGMVHLFTTTETTTATPNIMSTAGINTSMSNGDAITVTLITTAAAGAYCANIQIDGAAVTENWIGGSAPSDGGSSGVDVHTFTIIKTASETFTVLGNQSKTS